MKEIKAGEYVRTKDGKIDKVITGEFYIQCEKEIVIKNDIIKHSKDIIDLIEVGDYVNGNQVEIIYNGIIVIDKIGDYLKRYVREDEIKSIVTKEQFKSDEYRIF